MLKSLIALTILLLATNLHAAEFKLQSKSFPANSAIPPIYSCDGKSTSPQLEWSNAPLKTKSFALFILSDWTSTNVYLWVLYNIPNTMHELPEGLSAHMPDSILVGNNYYHQQNYLGPCPPDSVQHRYQFILYALDTVLDIGDGAEPEDVLNAMQSHILQKSVLIGTFKH